MIYTKKEFLKDLIQDNKGLNLPYNEYFDNYYFDQTPEHKIYDTFYISSSHFNTMQKINFLTL